jgi:hypothetical protein
LVALPQPRVWCHFTEERLRFFVEWHANDDWSYRLEIAARETDAIVAGRCWHPRTDPLRNGGLSPELERSLPLGQMQRRALELVRRMLAGKPRAAALVAGFCEHNAYPTIRPRGWRPQPALYAAVAQLRATGWTRQKIATETHYSESRVKSWLQRAREQGLLNGRELTAAGRSVLEEDGREALAIIADRAAGRAA